MTIDERLEKLAERHEALTQTVELLTRDIDGMKSYINEIVQATARLLHVAQIHEHRITREDLERAIQSAPQGYTLWTSQTRNPRRLTLSDSNKENAKPLGEWDFKAARTFIRELKDHRFGDKYRYFEVIPASEWARIEQEEMKAASREWQQ